ncbi:PD-(D/E)XK nuclease family protein [Rhodococcus sp. BP-149]|nr:PD-(D/E)XK nuclease family protein [Rhodococcus sp. BP-288]MBY6694347.1 PD-(D/E)XK nuclease family protein [Rhodococcus sp. BP-188]MBY6698056.1 PD-(D/E)XK nuclease family protein [Rhodococcus sp. BP-285]MBY6704276.1 PD-(D/E)XK nuclease family protein [Rhodococcus sp. BP-283]MBY6712925.1 PD-(D/E)XK nuclease family protein [Rhodococcus sp. BP-160]MBY6713945.1 PD-(D/E)XK nuclease family protein [Rhodococcus sp. BP-110]MBY6720899.1 PD-(D/E)XK nuclease family protein [Rhodococcus sp. BP-142]MB
MVITVDHSAPYRLVAAVVASKSADSLRTLTVVVPSPDARRDVTRALALSGGSANTRIVTLDAAVDVLAAPALTPRLPLPYPLLEASIERILDAEPGRFDHVADQPITAQALATASFDLTGYANPQAESTTLVDEMLRIHRLAVAVHSDSYYLRHEAYAAALANLDELGAIIVYLPTPVDAASAHLLDVMQKRGITVDATDTVHGSLVVHASDADDEVRALARIVRAHLADGIPGHRIGVFYGSRDPYLRLLHEHFAAGDIAFTAPECHGLADRPIARSLIALLELDPAEVPRRDLLAALAGRAVKRPMLNDAPISQSKLEHLTRKQVPIVSGTDWDRLAGVEPDATFHDTAIAMHGFVTTLRQTLSALASSTTWADASTAIEALIDDHFAAPTTEQASVDHSLIGRIVRDIADLDGIAPKPSSNRIADALASRIDAINRTVGDAAAAVTVGPLSAAAGRDLEVSIIVGAAEGIIPARRRADPLLPPELTGRTTADNIAHDRRLWTLALAAGRSHRIATFPRGSLRGGAEKVPSRWLLPTMEYLAGKPVGVVDWQKDTVSTPGIVTIESFDSAIQKVDSRIGVSSGSATEWRQRALAAVDARGRQSVLIDPVITNGMALRSDRLEGRFTRFNGNVSNVKELLRYFDGSVAPTGLEAWVASPYKFFLSHVLKVRALVDPDASAQIGALAKGTLIHAILEHYIRTVLDGEEPSLDRLLTIADRELVTAQESAPGWLPQLWDKDRALIRDDLTVWFAHDAADHANGWSPLMVEKTFADSDAVITVDGGVVKFNGSIDRVDIHSDGRVRVTDYKSGQAKYFSKLTSSSPTDSGVKFQLPVYGLFARTLGTDVVTRYWFITSKGQFDEVGYPLTDGVLDVLIDDVSLIHTAITSGYFPPRTTESYLTDDLLALVGKRGLERAWSSLEDVPEIDGYRRKYERS